MATPLITPPLPQAPGLQHIFNQSVEDLESEWHAERGASQQQSKKKKKETSLPSPPPPAVIKPVALGRSYTSAYTEEFNRLCQMHAVMTRFEYMESASPQGWGAKLTFGFGMLGEDDEKFVVEEKGPFTNKKEAKAAACEKAVPWLKEEIAKRGPQKKEKGATDEAEESTENWVGLLIEYCNATSTPQARYQEYAIGPLFACECRLGPHEPFGGQTTLFANKRTAKANAAREAVQWLRDQGLMPEKGHPKKKNFQAGAPNSHGNPGSDSDGGSTDKEKSYGAQVMALCTVVQCSQPQYLLEKIPDAQGFWNGKAIFPRDPLISKNQPVVEVHNVWGRNAAKQQLAKGVLNHLKAVVAQRQADAAKFLEQAGVLST